MQLKIILSKKKIKWLSQVFSFLIINVGVSLHGIRLIFKTIKLIIMSKIYSTVMF